MTASPAEEAPPRLFEHCITVFGRMKTTSLPTQIEGQHALVYEGFLTRLFGELGLATPYYTSVMTRLKKMGCVKQLSRGGGNSPSKWELIKEPDWELFEATEQLRSHPDTKIGQLQGQVASLNTRVAALEELVERMVS